MEIITLWKVVGWIYYFVVCNYFLLLLVRQKETMNLAKVGKYESGV